MADDDGEMDDETAAFAEQGKAIRAVLQTVEDTLVKAGYDGFVVATTHGTFEWRLAPEAATEAET